MEGENISEEEDSVLQSRLISLNKKLYLTILTQIVQINAGPTLQACTLPLQGELPILYAGIILFFLICGSDIRICQLTLLLLMFSGISR